MSQSNKQVIADIAIPWATLIMSMLIAGVFARRSFNNLWIWALFLTVVIFWVPFRVKWLRHPRSVWKHYKEELTEMHEIRRWYCLLVAIVGIIIGLWLV